MTQPGPFGPGSSGGGPPGAAPGALAAAGSPGGAPAATFGSMGAAGTAAASGGRPPAGAPAAAAAGSIGGAPGTAAAGAAGAVCIVLIRSDTPPLYQVPKSANHSQLSSLICNSLRMSISVGRFSAGSEGSAWVTALSSS